VYSEGSRFESRLGRTIVTEAFMLFLSSFMQMPGTARGLGHDQFIANPLQFVIHQFYHSTLYNFKL
jgi:hypothetical protein